MTNVAMAAGGCAQTAKTKQKRMSSDTDYEFPPLWGKMDDKQRAEWFMRERVYRRFQRQDRPNDGRMGTSSFKHE